MKPRAVLADNLANEAEAYGYTLSIWGAGALLVDAFGVPGFVLVLAYVAGALVGFAALAAFAFSSFLDTVYVESADSPLVVSMVHFLSTGGSLTIAFGAIHLLSLPSLVTFALVGVLVTVTYNLLLLAEELVADAVDNH